MAKNLYTFMTKEQLLLELQQDTYVALQPSEVHGIGVYAVKDIPKGCTKMFSTGVGEWLTVPRHEVDLLPKHSKDMVENFCLYDEENYFIPDYGFKLMDLVVYLNHSATPNIVSINEGETFEATRHIKAGEELFVDYGEIVDSEE